MKKTYINGFGIIAPELNNEEQLIQKVKSNSEKDMKHIVDLDEYLSLKEYRRWDRFSLLTSLSVEKALEHYNIDEFDSYDCGSILNTSYGPIGTNIEFISEYINDLESVSPIKFSHTVNNAAIGHICKKHKLKGPSTVLISSNYIAVAMNLLNCDKTKIAITCGAETYCKELFGAFQDINIYLTESAATLILSNEKSEQSLSEIIAYHEENLGSHYYFEKVKHNMIDMKRIMQSAIENANINASQIMYVIAACYHDEAETMELEAIYSLMDKRYCTVINTKKIIGETLGSSLGMDILYSGLLLQKSKDRIQKGYALVNNYNISGNFSSYIIGSV